jgi:uncharacterized protein YndB with AHSA1/START domain
MESSYSNGAGRAAENLASREIVISRVFDASRELLWDAWTDPKHLTHWWGPRGFTTTVHEMDLRSGGVWNYTMHGPDGTDYPAQNIFIEVVKPERIAYSLVGGKKGDRGVQSEVLWTFEQLGEKTRLTLRMLFSSPEAREYAERTYGVIEGGKQTLDRFGERLEKTFGMGRK